MTRRLGPFECEITSLGPRGVGTGVAPDGRPVQIRAAPPGARLLVVPTARARTGWTARRLGTIRPPARAELPRCAQFGLCGGCALQELGLPAQRHHKRALALAEIGAQALAGATVHEVRGADAAYGYRNKVELSFGPMRWLSEEAHEQGLPPVGRWLGFHAPGRFDRVVDAPRCELISEPMNEILARVRAIALAEGSPPPYDSRLHTGFFRHLLLREAAATGQRLAVLYTTTAMEHAPLVERIADDVAELVAGFQWRTNDGVADVARGELVWSRGADTIEERLGPVRFQLGPTSFFQTSTAGAEILYDTVGEALGEGGSGGTLLDLYCGIGSIGLYLVGRRGGIAFDRVLGLEENAESVQDAIANAAANGIAAEFRAARVEAALEAITDGPSTHVVVDPPRAGLHPKVAARLAGGRFASLVYVACNPASLGRDAAILRQGGWRLTDVWVVDLFPQTGHVEVVGRFGRSPP